MADVDDVLDGVTVLMPNAAEIRSRGSRRRAGRRLGAVAVVAAVVTAGAVWGMRPVEGGGEVRPAGEAAERNPYRVGGEIKKLADRDVPMFGTYHWKKDNEGSLAEPLTVVGFGGGPVPTPSRRP